MSIDTMTIGEFKEFSNLLNKKTTKENPFIVGEKYLIRTVTYFLLGEVSKITGDFVTLKNASWVADTGKFSTCINNGTIDEVEVFDVPVSVNMQSIVDFYKWEHSLPTETK